MIVKVFILGLIILLIYLLYEFINISIDKEYYQNWDNNIYSIRPPYLMHQYYKPSKLGPLRIYKYNFLNHWIRG